MINNLPLVMSLVSRTLNKVTRLGQLVPGSVWRHTKRDKKYMIVGVAVNTENYEKDVVYRSLYETDNPEFKSFGLWTRPLDNFLDVVTEPEDNPSYRFVHVEDTF